MYSNSVPIQELLLKQIVSEAGIVSKEQKDGLRKRFQKKFGQHINLMQYHRMREDRFVLSQKKVLECQNYSIQKTKEYLALRQNKASSNKTSSLIEKSKRVESDLAKWEKRVQHNKYEYEKRLKDSTRLIQAWNDKLSETSSRKSLRMDNISKTIHQKQLKKSLRAENVRHQLQEEHERYITNPQEAHSTQVREKKEKGTRITYRNSRVSTESMHDRKNKLEESLLEKSLMKTGKKQEKINEARFMKQYIMEKKKKLKIQKEQALRRVREQHLSRLRLDIESRNKILDKKFKKEKLNFRSKRQSLPVISGSKASNVLLLNGPGEEWRTGKKHSNEVNPFNLHSHIPKQIQHTSRTLQPNYDRLVRQKIYDIAHLLRKNRKF